MDGQNESEQSFKPPQQKLIIYCTRVRPFFFTNWAMQHYVTAAATARAAGGQKCHGATLAPGAKVKTLKVHINIIFFHKKI